MVVKTSGLVNKPAHQELLDSRLCDVEQAIDQLKQSVERSGRLWFAPSLAHELESITSKLLRWSDLLDAADTESR